MTSSQLISWSWKSLGHLAPQTACFAWGHRSCRPRHSASGRCDNQLIAQLSLSSYGTWCAAGYTRWNCPQLSAQERGEGTMSKGTNAHCSSSYVVHVSLQIMQTWHTHQCPGWERKKNWIFYEIFLIYQQLLSAGGGGKSSLCFLKDAEKLYYWRPFKIDMKIERVV